MPRKKITAPTAALPETLQDNYCTHMESEGHRWMESHAAPSLHDAELDAQRSASIRGVRVVVTLPLNPEA